MRPKNERRRASVQRLYTEGMTLRAIAKRYGVSYQAIHIMLCRMGVPRRPRGGNQGSHSRRRK
jgi:transposase